MARVPSGLDERAKRLWRRTLERLVDQGTWQEAYAPTLELYVQAEARARRFRPMVDADPFVKGSMGQLVPHPATKLLREAELDMVRYAEALLLTEQVRRRHGVGSVDESPRETAGLGL